MKGYFDYCYDFLKDKFGEENIVMAYVHYDEDTPHLQAYFLPVVNEVKRKGYEKDLNGNVIKELSKAKDGSEKLIPKLKRDNNVKILYENVKGIFLNNDQIWKDLGGKESYAKLQDSFNDYIAKS
ncbi:MAG: plasmid recombination protein [Bacilli bacterium]